MKISTNWLKDYVNLENIDLKELATKITNIGVNVETISSNEISNLVVGEVIEVVNHPDSDHLHICKVNIGNEILQIVCGAPNVREGLKVIVALIGAILPGDFEIKKSKIRGIESFGMLCALSELGLEDIFKDGIHELENNALVGTNPFNYLEVSNDTVYTLDLNPNRNDCLSHLGFAYEAGAALGQKVKIPETSYKETEDNINEKYELKVETDNCSLFLLKLVKDVKIEDSPKFIQDRLTSVGMRPINNVVDISNYIMLEYGQPLHFYDADKINKTIGVRMSNDKEVLKTLDGQNRLLSSNDIVITDGVNPIGLAGVMGGYSTEVDENTKNILVESAIFNPLLIRETSIRLDLRSEASLRFEKGLNYEYTYECIKRASSLLEKYASGKVTSGLLSFSNEKETKKIAEVSLEEINNLLGLKLTDEDVKSSFDKLGFKYENAYTVTIPNRRMDVTMKQDLIEEVGRMYGFEHIKGSKPIQELKKGGYEPRIKYRKDISKKMRALGLNEVRTYTLSSLRDVKIFNYDEKEAIKLDRPISKDRDYLRTSLIPSLIEIDNYNHSRSVTDINIYEIANVYHKKDNSFIEEMKLCILLDGNYIKNSWNSSSIKNDFWTLKGIVENLIHYLGLTNRCKYTNECIYDFMHPGMSANVVIDNEKVGFLGKINPSISKKEIYICELNLEVLMSKKTKKLKFTEPNKYPSVKRDVAFIVDGNITAGEIIKEIKSVDKNRITECIPFDEYKMDNKKSLAFALNIEDETKTMTEEEVNEIFVKVIETILKKFNAILRDK